MEEGSDIVMEEGSNSKTTWRRVSDSARTLRSEAVCRHMEECVRHYEDMESGVRPSADMEEGVIHYEDMEEGSGSLYT